jgi:hypothetical protein
MRFVGNLDDSPVRRPVFDSHQRLASRGLDEPDASFRDSDAGPRGIGDVQGDDGGIVAGGDTPCDERRVQRLGDPSLA